MRRLLLAASVCAALAAPAAAEDGADGWEPVRQAQGITVSRLREDGGLPTFRGTVVMEAELLEVVAVLGDDPRRTEWMSRCIESRQLEERRDGSELVYTRTKGSWPFADRDSVTATKLTLSPDGARIELRNAESRRMPPVRGVVRVPAMEGHYGLETVAPGRTRVEYQLSMQLGGRIPRFVAAFVEEDLPFETLRALREQVRKTRGAYAAEIEGLRRRLPSVAAPPAEAAGS